MTLRARDFKSQTVDSRLSALSSPPRRKGVPPEGDWQVEKGPKKKKKKKKKKKNR